MGTRRYRAPAPHPDAGFLRTLLGDREAIGDGAVLLRGYAAAAADALVKEIAAIADVSPFRQMITPGGHRMSVATTSCGLGWITDRRGYRYDPIDPDSGQPWPAIPPSFVRFAGSAAEAAGYASFSPDACLINRYEPDAKMGLHQDKDERDFGQPIVSVSLGLPAIFLWGGARRSDRPQRVPLASGDVVVWGGPSRLFFHGVSPLADGADASTGRCRYNLTFRRAR